MLRIQRMTQTPTVDAPQMIEMQLDLVLSVRDCVSRKSLAVECAIVCQHTRIGASRREPGRLPDRAPGTALLVPIADALTRSPLVAAARVRTGTTEGSTRA